MVQRLLAFLLCLAPAFAQITDLHQVGATYREVLVAYTSPITGACTVQVSESPSLTPSVPDVDTTKFAGSNSDFRNGTQGRARTFIVGAAGLGIDYAPVALDGLKTSRALQNNTDHTLKVTCGAFNSTIPIRTANISPGDTRPINSVPIDPAHLGEAGWPFLPWDASAPVIDPVTGVLIQQMWTYESNISPTGAFPMLAVYDNAGTWSNLSNLFPVAITDEAGTPSGSPLKITVSGAGNYNSTISVKEASTGTLLVQAGGAPAPGEYFNFNNGQYQFNPADTGGKLISYRINANDGNVASFTGSSNDPIVAIGNGIGIALRLAIRGFVDSITTTLAACITLNGATCYGPFLPITLPVGSGNIATVTIGDVDVYTSPPAHAPMMSAWLNANQQFPQVAYNKAGTASNVGNVLTITGLNGPGGFDRRWTTDTHITYNGATYKVLSVTNGLTMTITPTPPTDGSGPWASHQFGYLIKKTSVGGTVNIDYITDSPVPITVQINDQASGGSKQCTLSEYPQGFRIGLDRGSTGAACTNTSPISCTTTSPHDFVTGDTVKIRDVPGNTAANGTWPIVVTGARTFTMTGSDGTTSGVFPSDAGDAIYNGGGGLVWKLTASRGHVCVVSSSAGSQELYWVNKRVSPKTIVYLGPFQTQTVVFDGGIVSPGGVLGEEDPEIPAFYKLYTQSGVQELYKGLYIGAQPTGMFQPGAKWVQGFTQNPYIGIWHMTRLTAAQSVTAKIQAFDPTFPSGFNVEIDRSPKPGKLAFSVKYLQQNNKGWIGVYDTVSNSVVALMNTWQNSNARWAGLHTPLAWEGADQISWVPYNLDGKDGENGPMANKGPYQMTLTGSSMAAGPDLSNTCQAQLTAIGQSNPLNVTGFLCSTVTVDTVIPITPSTASPANDTLNNQGLRIGDLMKMTDQTAPSTARPWGLIEEEVERIIGFNTSTKQLVLQRAYVGVGSIELWPSTTHAVGNKFYMFSNSSPRWWDWVNAPHGETGTDPYQQNLNGITIDESFPDASHYFTRNALTVSDAGGLASVPGASCPGAADAESAEYGFRYAAWPNHINPPLSSFGCTSGNPPFAGIYGTGSGNRLEKHPSPVEFMFNNQSWLDYRPFATTGEIGDWGNPAINQLTTKISGTTYLYKTIRSGINGGVIDPKNGFVYVMFGRSTAYDVSAPGFTLPDTQAYNYTYCQAYVAGDCRSGSAVGDIYSNVPGVTPIPGGIAYAGELKCNSKQQGWIFSDYFINDICISPQPPYLDYAVQYSAFHDPYNTGARRITAGLRHPRTSGLTENTPATPDGDGLLMGSTLNGGSFPALIMPKVPPYPGRQPGINRATWIPLPYTITSVPKGTSTAYIRFGYSPSMYCVSRQEICVANAATLQTGNSVFSWETTDAPAGLACSTGCTITIPTLSQRVMWYQIVYKNSGGSTVFTEPIKTLVTP